MAGQLEVVASFKALKEAILNSAHKAPIIYRTSEEA